MDISFTFHIRNVDALLWLTFILVAMPERDFPKKCIYDIEF